MENSTFRSVAFGGFAKEDVVQYIEKTAQEAASLQETLQKENDSLRDSSAALSAQLAQTQAQLDALTAQCSQLRADLDRETALRQDLEPCKPETLRLAREVEALRPDAEAYCQFRQRIGDIECEARKRAADLEASTIAKLEGVVSAFQSQYQELMTSFDATASHVTGELRKVEVNLAQLPRAMDQAGAELKELSAVLDHAAHRE
ncbi:MAG: hypothetical protein RR350_09435 [Oscillibacter sp.]